MKPIALTPDTLKAIAHKTREQLKEINGKPSFMQVLHAMTTAAYGRTYEEVKATVTADVAGAQEVTLCFEYGTNSRRFVSAKGIPGGNFVKLPTNTVPDNATLYVLPEAILGDASDDDIIYLAVRMGYMSSFGSIFSKFKDAKIFVNSCHCPCGLNDDWLTVISHSDWPGTEVIWYPETNSDIGLYEYFVSFDNLCNAVTDNGKLWRAPESESTILIEFFY